MTVAAYRDRAASHEYVQGGLGLKLASRHARVEVVAEASLAAQRDEQLLCERSREPCVARFATVAAYNGESPDGTFSSGLSLQDEG